MTPSQLRSLAALVAGREESDAELAAILSADVTTNRPIPLASIAPLLRRYGVMALLRVIATDPNTDFVLRAGLSDFLDQLADPRQQTLDTTDPVIAGRVAATLAALKPTIDAQLGGVADTVIDSIYALGGGQRVGLAPTAEDVAAARRHIERQAGVDELQQALDANYARRHSILSSYRDSDAALPTIAELEAM